ncbi:hypothetical protein THICB1_150121 [Thiomonas arsenitoxydans]|uniref:Acyl-CoA dehydrogenase/oxidase C-terminal domain-containing protein n=1 Tax=Thiomonas arsenitoxydans (strain DSM 22701 / CIP 110005 / 3As) TaxID=426114 RepID=A0ABM9T5L9_THIA3|nr:hypothetical protein ACO3_170010 [Thiomonas arsenitoxydans]CQR29270.1 hypothetical protein ACO7_150010 [Thiomonas arsenitoxydans]CQR30784.1 hypothetical protein THICB1_150121 [Thiomonas arsenitoxydans]CQR35378.1 hypothetical protein THICB6_220003 [Thiomonas arsenitoxydans]
MAESADMSVLCATASVTILADEFARRHERQMTISSSRAAIDAIGATLRDSARSLVTAFGTLGLAAPGKHWGVHL